MLTAFTKYLTTWSSSKIVFNRHFKVQMDLNIMKHLLTGVQLVIFLHFFLSFVRSEQHHYVECVTFLTRLESDGKRNYVFFMFAILWVGESNSSLLSTAVIPLPHFTSLVINSLCLSSWVIGRTSSPVKRLISTPLCGWLKAVINNQMGFAQDLFSCTLLQPVMSGYLVNQIVLMAS